MIDDERKSKMNFQCIDYFVKTRLYYQLDVFLQGILTSFLD